MILTPLDGRYAEKVAELTDYLSEDALIKYRVQVEIEWLKKLGSVVGFQAENLNIVCDESGVSGVKAFEAELKHDVKAVEVWIGQRLKANGRDDLVPFVHFGRTSEDINSLAYALMLRDALEKCIGPLFVEVLNKLNDLANESRSMAMVARTHGQLASPTTFGKEVAVFVHRLKRQIDHIQHQKIYAKFSGATGTLAADKIAYPEIDWNKTMAEFIEQFGIMYNPVTTQIEPHDWIARLSNELALANTILIDLCRDFWQYISLGYINQKTIDNEVGSSTMPHKVNPIDFENAEANFGISNALLRHFAEKLPISRMQRDLSDSSVMRAHSEAYGHMLIALKSIKAGLAKIAPNPDAMSADLRDRWELLTEPIQTVMRKNGISDAYDQMKALSRGKSITAEDLHSFISALAISDEDKSVLLNLTPESYIGYSEMLSTLTD